MKKHLILALSFFVTSLLLPSPEVSQASITPKKIIQARPVKLVKANRMAIGLVEGKEKKKIVKLSPENQVVRLVPEKNAAGKKKAGGKFVKSGKARMAREDHKDIGNAQTDHAATVPPVLANVPDLDGLRQHYQDWRGTRYRAGGSSHAGVDCSGFTALTFRDVYGIELPRTAHEQAMEGTPVNRDSLLPGDLVFFKRGHGGDHVGIYLGNGKFMHASSRQGVIISSMNNTYWRNKFWKGSRL
jgi:cell wall-associated NlpC family hydrolase